MDTIKSYIERLVKKTPHAPRRGIDRSKMEITPFRDWRVVVGVFFVILVCATSFHIWMFMHINADNFVVGGSLPETSIAPLENNKLENALSELTKRSAKFEMVKASSTPRIDPSL